MIFDAHVHLPWQKEYAAPEAKMAHLLEVMEQNSISGALVLSLLVSENAGELAEGPSSEEYCFRPLIFLYG